MQLSSTLRAPLMIAAALTLLPLSALAQQGGRPPAPDFGPMAKALNVSESQIENCLPRPERGKEPTRPDAASVLDCLKASNADLTREQVAGALQDFAPAPPPRG
ncbi:hypothetical protein IV417_03275 [Alphaproteobacteria bacterium KMM 3653]|uniref:UrcA family protein n=1 Tax=Harenicola maris TaxID=2841044 RepID=A0AAP2G6M6_9RHOB|nr:hypothetical protein [Harenicola maris]